MPIFSTILEGRQVKNPGSRSGHPRALERARRPWSVWLLILGLVLGVPTWCGAAAYKSVDADGRVIYSDQPLPDAEAIALPGTASNQDAEADAGQAAAPIAAPAGAMLGPYEQFTLVAPAAGETLRSPEGKVQVSLMLSPPRAPDHSLEVQVDGALVEGLAGRTQFSLQGLAPGSHQIEARILDPSGAVVASTGLVSFNVLLAPAAADQP